MNFGEKLAKYLKEHNIEQKELAKLLGVKEQTVSAYITKKNNPTYTRFVQICTQLKIDANYFINSNVTGEIHQFNPEDQILIDKYKALSSHDREIVDYILDMEDTQTEIKPIIRYESIVTDDVIYLPLVEQKASAGIGDPTHQWSNESGKICFPKNKVPEDVTHAIIIDGYSMEPIFFNRQIVFINAEKECNDGDYGIFQVITYEKTDVYCKQLKYNEYGKIYLHSVNERADDPEFTEQEGVLLECIGKIITPL